MMQNGAFERLQDTTAMLLPLLAATKNLWLSGLADLVTFASMTIIALFLMWSPSEVLRERMLRRFGVLLSVCGMLHFVVFWHNDQPFVLKSVLTGLASASLLVLAAGVIFFLIRHQPAQNSLAKTRQSLQATQEQLSLEQHLLTALVDNMPDAIYFKDRESRFIRCNQSMADVFAVSSPADVVGRCDHDFFPKAEADVYRADELRIMHSGQPIINKEEYELWPDGDHHWVLSTKLPLRDTLQNIIGTFGLSRDISDLKQAETGLAAKLVELQALHTELQHSNRELEQFAYVASHDLQEPLRTIVGFCQLLEMEYEQVLDDNGRMYLETIVDGGKRMQRLIRDLLEYSRIGRQGGSFKKVSLRRIVDESLALLQSSIQESEAQIRIDELPDVLADESQMIRLFQNLIGNALKYRAVQNPTIHIRAVETPDSWKVYLSDNGIGIPREFSEQVFIIFKRLHTRSEYPGTGIGLSVCRRIVERHGGRLRLIYRDDPKLGDQSGSNNVEQISDAPPVAESGSTFEITLPKKPPQRVAVVEA